MIVVRAHHFAVTEMDWRGRVLAVAERATRATAPGALLAVARPPRAPPPPGMIVLLVPADGRRRGPPLRRRRRPRAAAPRSAASPSPSATRARRADPVDLYRAGQEALLAANVAEARPGGGAPDEPAAVLAFEDTGAYRLLLPAMSEDPGELQRFYDETIAPLVAYDEQYETDLVTTLETFLDCDGNVANTAGPALHPPPHDPLPARARARAHRPRRRARPTAASGSASA